MNRTVYTSDRRGVVLKRLSSTLLLALLLQIGVEPTTLGLKAFASTEEAPATEDLTTKHFNVPADIPEPKLYTLSINESYTSDIEVIRWPNGQFSLPVRYLAELLEMTPQFSQENGVIYFSDNANKTQVELDYRQQVLKVNDTITPLGPHGAAYSSEGLVVGEDVYIDERSAQALFGISVELREADLTLALETDRNLAVLSESHDTSNNNYLKPFVIHKPEISHHAIEKIILNYHYNTFRQVVDPVITPFLSQVYTTNISNNLTAGIQGSLFKQPFYIKPTFSRFNGQSNISRIDWNIRHERNKHQLDIGSIDVGLSDITIPYTQIYGIQLARKNAVSTEINSSITSILPSPKEKEALSFVGTPHYEPFNQSKNTEIASSTTPEINDDTVIAMPVIHFDKPNKEKLLTYTELNEFIPVKQVGKRHFRELLPSHEKAYSAFVGRTPFQFNPLEIIDTIPMLAPQSEKWLAGGRYAYGVNDDLTLSVAAAADRNIGKARTYFLFPNPLFVNLTGLNSYYRDANFFHGQNISTTANWALSDHWLLSGSVGYGGYSLKSGSNLSIPTNGWDGAGRAALTYQGETFNASVDAFHYGTNYYTPSTLYSNQLYDRQGIGLDVSGYVPFLNNTNYFIRAEQLQSNLSDIVPFGRINATHVLGNLSKNWQSVGSRWKEPGYASLGWDWTFGSNDVQDLTQKSTNFSLQQRLKWGIEGQLNFRQFLASYIQVPVANDGMITILNSNNRYLNNVVDANLKIPLGRNTQNYLYLGSWTSTFTDYAYARASLNYKHFYLEPFIQKSYGDKQQIQDAMGFRIGYQFPNGGRLGVGISQNLTDFQLNGIVSSKTKSTQVFVDFTEVIGLLANSIHALGSNGESAAAMVCHVFADLNHNDEQDKNEPGLPDIHLKLDDATNYTSDRKGRIVLSNLGAGPHKLGIDNNELPITLSLKQPLYEVHVKAGRTHKLSIPATVENGVVSGKLTVTRSYGGIVPNKHFILVLKDKSSDVVVRYTTTGEDGLFKITNVPPGDYLLDVEEKTRTSGRYLIKTDPIALAIPFDRKNLDHIFEQSGLKIDMIEL